MISYIMKTNMKIYNTLTRNKEEFIPQEEGKVKMYACGITVYDACHIGHARQAITYDMIRSYLQYIGYEVTYIRNYTDVDDKIIARANAEGIHAIEYSKRKIEEAEKDLKDLRVSDADVKPKASEYIEKIIVFVEDLIQKGYAYPSKRGDVYFRVSAFKEYGKLSNRKTDELISGVRKEVEEGKENPNDFALWKSAKPGEIYWESPWGIGRPGWHIECSVMSIDNLGETIDIHGGGKDLIFPHHENEICQSEAKTGKQFAKYWIHNGLITINGQKMSKSLGNTMTIREAIEKYHPEVIKYTMLEKHYSTELELNEKTFRLAEKQMYYFYHMLYDIEQYIQNMEFQNAEKMPDGISDQIEIDFRKAMDDDFNTSAAIANLFGIAKFVNQLLKNKKYEKEVIAKELAEIKIEVKKVFHVLGLLEEEPSSFLEQLQQKYLQKLNMNSEEIENKIKERILAKQEKNYELADQLRAELDAKGIILNDSKEGTTWDIKELYNV